MDKRTAGLGNIKHIIAIGSGKGGVGKSTIATNLAKALTSQGSIVGVLDADLYGPSQPSLMGPSDVPKGEGNLIYPVMKDGIKFVSMGLMNPSGKALVIRAPLAIKAIQQFLTGVLWGELDYLFIDLPPGTGDIQLTLSQQAKLTGAVIITTPQQLASDIAAKGIEMFQTVNVPIVGIVENMSGFKCPGCSEVTNIFSEGGGSELANKFGVPLLGRVPFDVEIMNSSDSGAIDFKRGDYFYQENFLKIVESFKGQIEKAQLQTKEFETEEIKITERGIFIKWLENGKETHIEAAKLRFECPCAMCVDEISGQKIIKKESIPMSIKALGVRPVGRYGISINFSDGHNTGIYKFEKLKRMASLGESSFSV